MCVNVILLFLTVERVSVLDVGRGTISIASICVRLGFWVAKYEVDKAEPHRIVMAWSGLGRFVRYVPMNIFNTV